MGDEQQQFFKQPSSLPSPVSPLAHSYPSPLPLPIPPSPPAFAPQIPKGTNQESQYDCLKNLCK
ncbi:hypothetical protein WUBG_06613 [Wuchereria bancrofti]|uniref:Uncharacterized protein n=1 Tax=Wuchereria bancrofti TaxID=6293 RepID=J9AMW6_WUCBA|nr:hypothetical protein WUBG_13486 [Wuchereria bancrofti]EJW82478.1 hypothetical protein WUBG_06613 [Wuchereria bancrofti]